MVIKVTYDHLKFFKIDKAQIESEEWFSSCKKLLNHNLYLCIYVHTSELKFDLEGLYTWLCQIFSYSLSFRRSLEDEGKDHLETTIKSSIISNPFIEYTNH